MSKLCSSNFLSSFEETFQMGKVHKDIAMFMVNLSKNEDKSNEEFVMVGVHLQFHFNPSSFGKKNNFETISPIFSFLFGISGTLREN